MTGGTVAHAAIQANLLAALVSLLRGKPCRAFGSDLKIQAEGRIRYPDAFVVCTPVSPQARLISDPVIIFEILSPSTAEVDLIDKNAEYRAISSVRRYVVLEQHKPAAMSFFRRGEDWLSEIAGGADAMLALPEIELTIPLAELYAGLDLAPPPEADGAPAV